MEYRELYRAGLYATLALVMGLVATQAGAAEPERWYIGGSSGKTHLEVWRGLGWETSAQEKGLLLRGGFNVSRRVDLELGVSRASNLQWTEFTAEIPNYLTSHSTFDATSLSVSAIVRLNRSDSINVYIQAGMAWSRLSGQQTLDTLYQPAVLTRGMSGRGTDYLLGSGLAVKVAPHWRLRLEYQFYGVDAGPLGVRSDTSVDTFSIGVDYYLGRRSSGRSTNSPAVSR